MKTYLYRHYSDGGELLYVGISLSVYKRLAQHKDSSRWFDSISSVKIEGFPTREAALEAEKEAIKNESPKFNIQHKKTVAEIEAEEKTKLREERKQQSLRELTHRFVRYNITYKVADLPDILGMKLSEIDRYIDEGILPTFTVEGKKSGRWPIKMHRMVTGWALIDFVEYLEANR